LCNTPQHQFQHLGPGRPAYIEILTAVGSYDAEAVSLKLQHFIHRGRACWKGDLSDAAEAAIRILTLPGSKKTAYTNLLQVAREMQQDGEASLGREPRFCYTKKLGYRMDEALLEAAVWKWVNSNGRYTFENDVKHLNKYSNGRPMRRAMQFMDCCTRPILLRDVYLKIAQRWTSKNQERLPSETALIIGEYAFNASVACAGLPSAVHTPSEWAHYLVDDDLYHLEHPKYGMEFKCPKGLCLNGLAPDYDHIFWSAASKHYIWMDGVCKHAISPQMQEYQDSDLEWRHVWNANRCWPETAEERDKAGTSEGTAVCRRAVKFFRRHDVEWPLVHSVGHKYICVGDGVKCDKRWWKIKSLGIRR